MTPPTLRHLQCIGRSGYTGIDHVTGEVIKAKYLQLIVVSPQKAAQLVADFPNDWTDLGNGNPLSAEIDAPNVVHCTQPRRQ